MGCRLSSEKEAILALTMVQGIGPIRYARLIRRFGSAIRVWKYGARQNLGDILPLSLAEQIVQGPDYARLAKVKKSLQLLSAWALFLDDDEYPWMLKQISNPPPVLFGLGDRKVLQYESVAIVGSRKATDYGIRVAKFLAGELAQRGFNIVSGLALGIDSAAHRAALDSGGNSTGVKGCGLDIRYPLRNLELAKRLAKTGAVITEFLPGTRPEPQNFPARNRIISGLSKAVIVVEGDLGSGSLITAYQALDQGREVMAVPGNIFSRTSKGCHHLIKQGATLVEEVQDVLDALGVAYVGVSPRGLESEMYLQDLSEEQRLVVDKLEAEPQHIDDIAQKSGLPAARVGSILIELELKGLASSCGAGRFCSIITSHKN